MTKAAPRPVFCTGAQSAGDGILMNVVQLLYKLIVITDVEIVVALLPEVGRFANQAGERLLVLET